MKKCKDCQVELNESNCNKGQFARKFYICKVCWKPYSKKYRDKNPNSIKTHNAKPISRFNRLKFSTRKRGHEVTISFEEFKFITDEPCIYCHNKLCKKSEQGSNLDRIDNSKGYTIDNIQPCCKVCNAVRNQFLTVEETHVVINALMKFRGF